MNGSVLKGPRPLSLHISNSQITWAEASRQGVAVLDAGIWHADLEKDVQALRQEITDSGITADALEKAIKAKASRRKDTFAHGINDYLQSGYQPQGLGGTVVKTEGGVQLHDYGGSGQPVFMVTSLINPSYVVDLMPGRSLVAFLKEQGFRPYVVNWGEPGPDERRYGVEDYIVKRLQPFLSWLVEKTGHSVPVVGYCMGGTLTVGLAARLPDCISKLILMAAPWDFNASIRHPGRRYAVSALEKIARLPESACVSVDMLQSFFTSVDPTLSDRKFRRYASGAYAGDKNDFFSALEIWANNGPPLPQKVAQDCLRGWYLNNDTAGGRWHVAGTLVDPSRIKCPVLLAAPPADRLVPQESALALAGMCRQVVTLSPPSGHIGMVVGDQAREGLWVPLIDWLRS